MRSPTSQGRRVRHPYRHRYLEWHRGYLAGVTLWKRALAAEEIGRRAAQESAAGRLAELEGEIRELDRQRLQPQLARGEGIRMLSSSAFTENTPRVLFIDSPAHGRNEHAGRVARVSASVGPNRRSAVEHLTEQPVDPYQADERYW